MAEKRLIVALVLAFSLVQPSLQQPSTRMQPFQLPLNVTSISFSDLHPVEGETVTITARITNNSSRDVADVVVVFMQDQEKRIGNSSSIDVPANGFVDVSVPWIAEPWSHVITALLQVRGAPLPSGMLSRQIQVRGKPLGDSCSVVACLLIVAATVSLSAMAPSVLSAARRRSP